MNPAAVCNLFSVYRCIKRAVTAVYTEVYGERSGREFFKTYRYDYRFLNFKLIRIVGTVDSGAVKHPAFYLESCLRLCSKG